MSYDLFFRWRNLDSAVSEEGLLQYFRSRPLYEVSGNQAWYSNETTGVYFLFEMGPEPEIEPDEEPPSADLAPVMFNLNYFRPHFFGLEAEPELTAFVRKFDLLVSDPQNQGMGEGEYSPEGFLRGWNAGNEFGYRAILTHQDASDFHSLPTSVLESLWQWNLTRDSRHETRGDEIYIPRIFYFEHHGLLRTGVAWGDAMPILLPKVDLLIVPRKELAPRGLFKRSEDVTLLEWADVEPIVNRFAVIEDALPAHSLEYTTPPDDLANLIRSKKPPQSLPQGIAPDQVLNSEIFEEINAEKA